MTKPIEKLSDREARTYYPFRGPANKSFTEAFPDVREVQLRLVQGEMGSLRRTERMYTVANFVRVHDCPNPPCRGGGIDLETIVRDAVRRRDTTGAFVKSCVGNTPRGRNPKSCPWVFEGTLIIDYRTDVDQTESSDHGLS